ncbi:cobyrinate a,c-diamide synthase [Thalassolituus sp. LLYu03]|uniref:cobyrinate a,c-diamide synthase n=1 Tax=Thalassolituus sp. LLYu03 TaxID=3421656 RepID=UPI003D2D8DDD
MPACPALFLSAPASGQGKTTISAFIARWLRNQGLRVRVFKTGPDYLDPQILQQASGQPVEQLDIWMCGETYCRERLALAAASNDLILIEGAMGMFDGNPSSADLAALFNIPVAVIMDVSGMAQTAAALVNGLAMQRADVRVAGLIANRCGSQYHADLIRDALPDSIPLLFSLQRNDEVTLPERHLGLVQACEIADELEPIFERGAALLAHLNARDFLALAPVVEFHAPVQSRDAETLSAKAPLAGKTIAIARDAAFSFIYSANTGLLETLGAELRYFSPLTDAHIPPADALWLPGGYPELHAHTLQANHSMRQSLREFHQSGKPILAECGGFLYCLEQLTQLDGTSLQMAGLLPGTGVMRDRGGCQGMQTALLPEGEVRGHAHHRSAASGLPEALSHARRSRHPAPGEAMYRVGSLTAGYLHLFFPANPQAIADLFSGAVQAEPAQL